MAEVIALPGAMKKPLRQSRPRQLPPGVGDVYKADVKRAEQTREQLASELYEMEMFAHLVLANVKRLRQYEARING